MKTCWSTVVERISGKFQQTSLAFVNLFDLVSIKVHEPNCYDVAQLFNHSKTLHYWSIMHKNRYKLIVFCFMIAKLNYKNVEFWSYTIRKVLNVVLHIFLKSTDQQDHFKGIGIPRFFCKK